MLGQATQLMISGKGAETPVGESCCAVAAAASRLGFLRLMKLAQNWPTAAKRAPPFCC
jgi:hypothetical protein